jgi:hypothetical protein
MPNPVISPPATDTTLDLAIPRGLLHPSRDYTRQEVGPAIEVWAMYGSGFLCGILFALFLGVVTAVVPAGTARFVAGAGITIIALIAFTIWQVRKAAEKLDQRLTAVVMDNRFHLATVAAKNGEKADRLFVGQQAIINGIARSTNSQIEVLREYAESAGLWAAWNEQFGTRVAAMERALAVLPQVLEHLARLEKAEARRQARRRRRRSGPAPVQECAASGTVTQIPNSKAFELGRQFERRRMGGTDANSR